MSVFPADISALSCKMNATVLSWCAAPFALQKVRRDHPQQQANRWD
jgi:hypothetical protein